MKKLITPLGVLLVFSQAFSSAALPPADLAALARYVPSNSDVVIGFRTDDAIINNLQVMIDRIGETFDVETPSLWDELDGLLQTLPFERPVNWDEAVRSWVGDSALIAYPNISSQLDDKWENDYMMPISLVFELTSQQALADVIAAAVGEPEGMPLGDLLTEIASNSPEDYGVTVEGDVIHVAGTMNYRDVWVYIDDSALVLANTPHLVPTVLGDRTLETNETFINGINHLTLPSYDGFIYTDLAVLLQAENTSMSAYEEELLQDVFSSLSEQIIGFSLNPEQAVVFDVVQVINPEITSPISYNVCSDDQALDREFLRYIPAGSQVVMHGDQFLQQVEMFFVNMFFMAEASTGMPFDQLDADIRNLEDALDVFLGLDLQEDILSWMNGNFAFSLRISPSLSDAQTLDLRNVLSEMPVDGALLIEVTDSEKARNFVAALETFITASTDDDDDFAIESLTVENGAGFMLHSTDPSLPFPINLGIAANESVFVIGTEASVQAALSPSDSFLDSPQYAGYENFALANMANLFYVDANIFETINAFVRSDRSMSERDRQEADLMLNGLSNLIQGFSFTNTCLADGVGGGRMVLHLEPR